MLSEIPDLMERIKWNKSDIPGEYAPGAMVLINQIRKLCTMQWS